MPSLSVDYSSFRREYQFAPTNIKEKVLENMLGKPLPQEIRQLGSKEKEARLRKIFEKESVNYDSLPAKLVNGKLHYQSDSSRFSERRFVDLTQIGKKALIFHKRRGRTLFKIFCVAAAVFTAFVVILPTVALGMRMINAIVSFCYISAFFLTVRTDGHYKLLQKFVENLEKGDYTAAENFLLERAKGFSQSDVQKRFLLAESFSEYAYDEKLGIAQAMIFCKSQKGELKDRDIEDLETIEKILSPLNVNELTLIAELKEKRGITYPKVTALSAPRLSLLYALHSKDSCSWSHWQGDYLNPALALMKAKKIAVDAELDAIMKETEPKKGMEKLEKYLRSDRYVALVKQAVTYDGVEADPFIRKHWI